MTKASIPKDAKPPVHSSPRRWARYVARNLPLIKPEKIKKPERYLNQRARFR